MNFYWNFNRNLPLCGRLNVQGHFDEQSVLSDILCRISLYNYYTPTLPSLIYFGVVASNDFEQMTGI